MLSSNYETEGSQNKESVISFQQTRGARRHQELVGAMKFLPWRQQVAAIRAAVNAPLTEDSNTAPGSAPQDSIIVELKFPYLSDFVQASVSKNGLGMDWSKWQEMEKADMLAQKFVIEGTPEAILGQVDRVSSYLKRLPVNGAEYHRAILAMRDTELENIQKTYLEKKENLTEKISYLANIVTKEKAKYSELKAEHDIIIEATNFTSVEDKEMLEAAIRDAKESGQRLQLSKEKLEDLQRKVYKLQLEATDYNKEIIELKLKIKEGQLDNSELEDRAANAERKYEESTIEISDLASELLKMKSENKQTEKHLAMTNNKIVEANTSISKLKKTVDHYKVGAETHKKETNEFKIEIEQANISLDIVNRENSEVISELTEALEIIESSSSTIKSYVADNENKRALFEEVAFQLDSSFDQMDQAEVEISQLRAKIKDASKNNIKLEELNKNLNKGEKLMKQRMIDAETAADIRGKKALLFKEQMEKYKDANKKVNKHYNEKLNQRTAQYNRKITSDNRKIASQKITVNILTFTSVGFAIVATIMAILPAVSG